MADSGVRRVAHDLLGEPHIRGRRISVRQVAALLKERDTEPETVADRFGLDVANVYHALAYCHDHPGEMQAVKRERAEAIAAFSEEIERPDGVDPETTGNN